VIPKRRDSVSQILIMASIKTPIKDLITKPTRNVTNAPARVHCCMRVSLETGLITPSYKEYWNGEMVAQMLVSVKDGKLHYAPVGPSYVYEVYSL